MVFIVQDSIYGGQYWRFVDAFWHGGGVLNGGKLFEKAWVASISFDRFGLSILGPFCF